MAPWLKGEVRRHCAQCGQEVDRLERCCSSCSAQLRKECLHCHYWVEIDAAYCIACRQPFPVPAPPRATVKLWHE